MCFDQDYDWYAELSHEETKTADDVIKCSECRQFIQPGDFVHYVYQQEYEECRICEDEESEHKCNEHDYGETFEYYCCRSCYLMLKTIKQYEIKEGCPIWASHPGYCVLYEELNNNYESGEWVKLAIELYPELHDRFSIYLNKE